LPFFCCQTFVGRIQFEIRFDASGVCQIDGYVSIPRGRPHVAPGNVEQAIAIHASVYFPADQQPVFAMNLKMVNFRSYGSGLASKKCGQQDGFVSYFIA
jgi:hypothetical protein